MKRREFITLLGGVALGCPLAANAQPTKQVVGFLGIRSPTELTHLVAAFHHGQPRSLRLRFLNVWSKTPEGWKFVAWQSTSQPQ